MGLGNTLLHQHQPHIGEPQIQLFSGLFSHIMMNSTAVVQMTRYSSGIASFSGRAACCPIMSMTSFEMIYQI